MGGIELPYCAAFLWAAHDPDVATGQSSLIHCSAVPEARARLDFVARDLPGEHKLPAKSKAFEGEPKSEREPGICAEVALKSGDAFKVGWDAYKRRDYATATREFMALAERGDARAQFVLFIMLMLDETRIDEGRPLDLEKLSEKLSFGKWLYKPDAPHFEKAARWFRGVAKQGDAKAWTLLGHMYSGSDGVGFGVPHDYGEAMKLWFKAAEQGEVTAQKSLTFMFLFQNKMTEANYWFRKAAEQGDRWAQMGLGNNYMGGPQSDKLLAYMWLDLAAAQGARGAAENRDHVAMVMTPDQIAEAQRLAREWEPKSD